MKKLLIVLALINLFPSISSGATLNLQVGVSSDDARQAGSTMLLTGVSLPHGDVSGGEYNPGYRFTGVSGLSGMTINSATLTFKAATTNSGNMIGDWYAHDAEAPGTFTTASNNITSRPRTTATSEGDGVDFGNWTVNNNYTFTGDGVNTIADIIQELADSYDPSTIALLWIVSASPTNAERRVTSYDTSSSNAAKLDIDYTPLTPSVVAPIRRVYIIE